MDRQWKLLIIREGNELKTIQQLDALHVKYQLAIQEIIIDGITHQKLQRNGMIEAFINKKEEEHVKQLPYVKDIG